MSIISQYVVWFIDELISWKKKKINHWFAYYFLPSIDCWVSRCLRFWIINQIINFWMKFCNAMADDRFSGEHYVEQQKCQCRRRKKDTSALQMSHWEHIGYIYQSRKHYRVNNISVWHFLHIQKLDLQIFSFQGYVVIIKKIKPWVYTAVTLHIYSKMTWPQRMHHHAPTTISLQEAESRSPRSAVKKKKLCDSGEVAKHCWASVFSSDELDDFRGTSVIPFNCLNSTWYCKKCWRELCYKRWIKADVKYGRCYG